MRQSLAHRTILAGVAAAALALLTEAVTAQITPEQQSAMRTNCRSDFMSKCSGVSPGGKEALACLQKNVASLSSGCKAVVSATLPPAPAVATPPPVPAPAAVPAAAPPAPPPPAAPAQRAVAPAPPPPAAPATAQVTPAQQDAIRAACRSDFMAKCAGVTPGGKEAMTCLQTNAASLSPACRTAVSATMPASPPAAAAAKPPAVKTATPTPTAKPAQPAAPMTITPAAPAVAAVTPAAPAPSSGPPPAAALMLKACARYIVMHCRGIEPGGGRIAACLNARVASGDFVGPRCKTALKVSAALD